MTLDFDAAGLKPLSQTSDGRFSAGGGSVQAIHATGDGKVELVSFRTHTLAHVTSSLGYPAYYPFYPAHILRPVTAVLMDLDGTSVRSEGFWIRIIQQTVATLLDDRFFQLAVADLPYVSGHSVSEHLQYCVDHYLPGRTVEEARPVYFSHARREIQAILSGGGHVDAFVPAQGLKEFLLALKAEGVRIGLVTSGLHEKAWPEIVAAFRLMGLGDPRQFYDSIITAGFPLAHAQALGEPGTLGELCPKPHPWLYAEVARVGLGIPFSDRARVVGIEDSSAGVCSIRLAGFAAIGVDGGNIEQSGARGLCTAFCDSLEDVLPHIL